MNRPRTTSFGRLRTGPARALRPGEFSVGTILRPHGLKGEVKIKPRLSDLGLLERVSELTASYPDGRVDTLRIASYRRQGKAALIRFSGCSDRTMAEGFSGAQLSIPRADLPPLGEGQYYLGDLVDYLVVGEDGERIGIVEDAWDLPANDVLQVKREGGEALIPLVDGVVREIDHAGRQIVISVMEGLLA